MGRWFVSAHVPTMLLMILVISGTMALAVLFVARGQHSDAGLRWWGSGLLLNTLAFGLFGVSSEQYAVWPLVLGNFLQSAAISAAIKAIQDFYGRPMSGIVLVVPACIVAGVSLIFSASAQWRVPLVEITFALQTLFIGWTVFDDHRRHRERHQERGRLLIAGGMVLLTLIYVQRVVQILNGNQPAVDLLSSDSWQTLSYIQGLAGLLLSTLGFLLMREEHAEYLLKQMAMQDVLTGIANRRSILAMLEHALAMAARQREPLTVAMLDIDRFKRINDRFGHLVGDAALCAVVDALRDRLRNQDMLGRYGGEEFLLILPRTDALGGLTLAEALRAQVARAPLNCEGVSLPITVSIGVHTRIPVDPTRELHEMIQAADQGLYQAKQNGRNQICGGT